MKILLKVDPIRLRGVELTIPDSGEPSAREFDLEPDIFEQLKAEGFSVASPLEFHLYDAGLISPGAQ